MPAHNPFEHNPETEGEGVHSAEAFCPEDWLGAKTEREIIHIERKVLLEEVRAHLLRITPLLRANDGFCFFKTWPREGEQLTVVVTDREHLTSPGCTTVSSNLLRPANTDEPHFPDGQSLLMTDLVIPRHSRWLSYSWETFERGQRVHRWDAPKFATIHEPHDTHVKLVGNLATGPMEPCPAGDLDGVREHSWIYWESLEALRHCNEVAFEESIKEPLT